MRWEVFMAALKLRKLTASGFAARVPCSTEHLRSVITGQRGAAGSKGERALALARELLASPTEAA